VPATLAPIRGKAFPPKEFYQQEKFVHAGRQEKNDFKGLMIQVYHIPLHDQREIMERPFFILGQKGST